MVAFDVAAAIAEFIADSERTSLELPHMTTGQRKSTKKLLEQYPELRSESFGFGAERQLHIFKKSATDISQSHDCVAASPERSTDASTRGSSLQASPMTSDADMSLPIMHGELMVRNTFIHMESPPADERAVQSMPHGMFRRCILSECSKEVEVTPVASIPSAEPEAEPTVPSTDDEAEEVAPLELCPGALVVVEGLVKLPAFNGRSAVVQSFDEETGRYNILIASSGNCQQAKIKKENLRVVLPCP